jgi:hypothetical protein
MSKAETGMSYPRRAGEAFEPTIWDHVRINTSVVIHHGLDVLRALRRGKQNRIISELGNSFKENNRFPEIAGLDVFEEKVREIVHSERKPHLLVAGNHPDFLRAGLQKPLWYTTIPYVMGEVRGEDPYVFVSGKMTPEFLARRTHAIRVWSEGSKDGLNSVGKTLLDDERHSYLILPEGASCRKDRMIAARTGGVLQLLDIAVTNNVPLAVLPVALVQETRWRGEVRGKDRYAVHTGKEVYADELLPTGFKSTAGSRGEVIDRIMTDIAEMMPKEKRGYYDDFVERSRLTGLV